MTFEVGSLAASLQIEGMSQFENDLSRAGNALDRAGQKGASFGRAGEAAVRTAAGATVALTSAAGAYLAVLTATGVSYNSLQQNSRAALTTILGGSEKANAQMDKLDAFAKNSPFSKGVFIGAQQQLLSFGVEAQKVIPYLDAVQNSIATAGGSNADLEAVVATMSKVQSSAKITAQDLMEFGNRGINAAELIGSQMGLTGAEIREKITEGTLGATEALDALTAGMSERFGGSTDLIKEQWTGAVDRIKAANRDLGASIAEPFVSKNGGGMAVTWGNQVADVLRAVEKQAVPVMQILTTRGASAFEGLTVGLDNAQRSIQNWDSSKLDVFLDKLGAYAPAIGLTSGALVALGTSVGPLGALFGSLGLKVNPLLGGFIGLAATSPELQSGLRDVLTAAQPLGSVMGDVAKVMAGALAGALPVVSSGLSLVASVATPLVDIITRIPAPLMAGVGAFLALKSATNGLDLSAANAGVLKFIEAIGQSDAVRGFNAGLSPTTSLLAGVGQAGNAAKAGVLGLGDALKTAFLSNPVGVALTVISVAIGAWAMANADAQAKVQAHKDKVAELRGTLDSTTASLTESSRAMVAESAASEEMANKLKEAGISGQSYTRALIDGGGAARNFEHDLLKSAQASIEASDKTEQLSKYAQTLGVSYNDLIRSGLGYEDAQAKINASMRESGADSAAMSDAWTVAQGIMNGTLGTQKEVSSAYSEMSSAISDAVAEQHRINAAVDSARSSMSDAGRATQDYNAATATATDATASLEERVRALKTAYDILTGGASSAAEANAQVDASNLALAEGFAKVDENGVGMWSQAINLAESATNYVDTSTKYGQELFGALQAQQDATLQASIVARDTAINNGSTASEAFTAAKTAAEEYNAGLSQSLTDAGIVGEAHAALMEAWSIQPDVAAFTVTDNGTMDEATLRALQLAIDVESVPDKTITISEPMSPEVQRKLKDLGFTIEAIPGTKDIKVSQTGAEAADDAITRAARNRESVISVQQILYKSEVLGPVKDSATGNLFAGGQAQAFATGGFASGFYKAPPGAAAIHKFAERELEWEAYISPKPGFKAKNVNIAMAALARLGEPVVTVASLRGVPGFASGDIMGSGSSTPTVTRDRRFERNTDRTAPLAETIYIGAESTRNDLYNLSEILYRKEGRR